VRLLNVGCGSAFHPAWVNIDIVSSSPLVRAHDIRKGLPYPDASFDACYSSHVIEHLTRDEVGKLSAELLRVLKPCGVVRIVVPDLEAIVKTYLDMLEQVESGCAGAEPNYDWMMLELYDQTVRGFVGGEMAGYLRSPNIRNKDFILSRIGPEAERFWEKRAYSGAPNLWAKIRRRNLTRLARVGRISLAKALVTLIAGREARKSFDEGIFRNSGEIHRWMYDRFSLRRLLARAGFEEIRVCRAEESRILNFNSYDLDVIGSKVRKPDSLFMEGIKP
jgi:SAM-dependent methyltransferase